jgi:hypothetical protein
MRQSILLKSFIVIVAGVAVVGGAIFVGFRHASDVQGEGDVHAGEPGPSAAAGTPADQVRAYMLSLRADDYTTYTHPVFGFSLAVPKEFEIFRTTTADNDHTVFRHPRLPLALEITVYPMLRHSELVSWLAAVPANYELEPPVGADSMAAGWLDENQSSPGQQTMHEWFAYQDSLYEVLLMAPNPKLLQWWRPQVVNTDLSLSAR